MMRATVSEPPPAPKPNEQVQAFVDAVRVTGIRASGEDSRVLMNGRHYRLNEVVERTLRTYAKHVLPELKSWNIPATYAA